MHKSQFSSSLLGDSVLAERLPLEAATVPTAKKSEKTLKLIVRAQNRLEHSSISWHKHPATYLLLFFSIAV